MAKLLNFRDTETGRIATYPEHYKELYPHLEIVDDVACPAGTCSVMVDDDGEEIEVIDLKETAPENKETELREVVSTKGKKK